MNALSIKEVAQRTGLAAGTIRMWEQRYGFPCPERAPSGYRMYREDDVAALQRVAALRARGLSVPAALAQARDAPAGTDRPSIYASVSGMPGLAPQRLHKRTLHAISRAIEDETIARAAGPFVAAAFQAEPNYRAVEHRYRRLAEVADESLVFANFDVLRCEGSGPAEVPVSAEDAVGSEWAVIVDAPGFAACLLAWERFPVRADGTGDSDRTFEAVWTIEPQVVRRAAQAACAIAARADPDLGRRCNRSLEDRPLAVETPGPVFTALTSRMISYIDG